MFVLGIDTATRVAGAAAAGADRLISERLVHNLQTHSENLIPMISQVMEDAGLKPSDLDGIAVTGGPGSFTGLRIGMSAAKAMGLALNLPVISISTLEALAWNVYRAEGLICPILDAKKKEVYTCVYRSGAKGLDEVISPHALSLEELIVRLEQLGADKVHFLGDGVPVFGESIKAALGERALFVPMINAYPRAGAVAELGLAKLQSGFVQDSTLLQPVYLRRSEAEITWEQKQAKACEGGQ
ncbi:MAG: tRNA (adenosine(37)-N6)-threonylcarbamoyltransferase complex dimerization subunit type 1 TsaB [Thermincola sp.]|nr:tRNA (adenosine(37)-N6)-threonylcarbamoyltransferase complex dimerization subunit type 1 TsaB [Thermincola sp.]MDT3704549.1 tRNA (adenosine(37)-N6)-threonylcarbamoyltransferase complex dimerization subunit type 1 TsaB [Thermincola sp.]